MLLFVKFIKMKKLVELLKFYDIMFSTNERSSIYILLRFYFYGE